MQLQVDNKSKYNDFHVQIKYEVDKKKQIHIQSLQAHDAAQTAQTHKRQSFWKSQIFKWARKTVFTVTQLLAK